MMCVQAFCQAAISIDGKSLSKLRDELREGLDVGLG